MRRVDATHQRALHVFTPRQQSLGGDERCRTNHLRVQPRLNHGFVRVHQRRAIGREDFDVRHHTQHAVAHILLEAVHHTQHDDERRQDAETFLAKYPSSLAVLYDPKGEYAQQYGLETMPTSLIVDRKGAIRYRHNGFLESKVNDYEDHIRTVLRDE